MPQTLTAAPLNPSPRWPSGYVEVLREAGAQEKTIPFCLGWVRRFFAAHPGRRRRDLGRAQIEAFLRSTANHPGVSNWQMQQARDALETYYERFRGIALAPRPDGPVTSRTWDVPASLESLQELQRTHRNHHDRRAPDYQAGAPHRSARPSLQERAFAGVHPTRAGGLVVAARLRIRAGQPGNHCGGRQRVPTG